MELIENNMRAELSQRWDRMRENMIQAGADGCLLNIDVNLYYTTGRVFNGYFYLPADGEPWFFVKRPNGLTGENVEYIRKPEQIPDILRSKGAKLPKNLMLEGDEITYNDYMRLLTAFGLGKAGNATALMRKIKTVKTLWEIAQFRQSAERHAAAYSHIKGCFRKGMTDVEFQYEIERVMRENGSLGIFRAFGSNMDIFVGSLLAGDNAGAPSPFDFALGGGGMHPSAPIGANGTALKNGMSVMIDMGGTFTPYITDMTRVFSVGELTDLAYRAHEVSREIERETEKISKPGTACCDIYNLAVEIAGQHSLHKYFMGTEQQAKFVGHGIGLQINELPVLTPRSKEVLEEGMVFALEPKFVIPGVGAVGNENSFVVTASGIEKLTRFEEGITKLD